MKIKLSKKNPKLKIKKKPTIKSKPPKKGRYIVTSKRKK